MQAWRKYRVILHRTMVWFGAQYGTGWPDAYSTVDSAQTLDKVTVELSYTTVYSPINIETMSEDASIGTSVGFKNSVFRKL